MSATITTVAALEDRIGKTPALAHLKVLTYLDEGALRWIEAAPLMIASIGAVADVRITLGGGEPGWASGNTSELRLPACMLDDPSVARPGCSFGSIFLLPSIREVLRVNGKVIAVDGEAIRVRVEECYFHCGKALIRSEFWQALPFATEFQDVASFAAASRFLALATIDAQGRADLSPKGDPAGLMARLQAQTAWFCDRPGNKRIDSFRNIITQPNVAAMLLLPACTQVAVMRGVARITADEQIRSHFIVQDKVPTLATGIDHDGIVLCHSPTLSRARLWPAAAAPEGIDPIKIAVAQLKRAKSMAARLASAAMSVPGVANKALEQDYKTHLF